MGPYQRAAILFFVTGAGTGYLPWFPGTAGTLLAIPLSLALNRLATASWSLSLLTLIAFILIATWFCARGEEIFHQRDCRKIVIDEVAGFLLANFLSPPEVKPFAAAFLLFRFFDIMKVFPASRVEQIQGGVGVILDDLVAGLYTFFILRLLYFWSFL
ncbi:MAG: phosphatidylglycerophosphatase A family protein [Candidatus Binatia bacterium]